MIATINPKTDYCCGNHNDSELKGDSFLEIENDAEISLSYIVLLVIIQMHKK